MDSTNVLLAVKINNKRELERDVSYGIYLRRVWTACMDSTSNLIVKIYDSWRMSLIRKRHLYGGPDPP